MTAALQQAELGKSVPVGNRIAAAIMLGLGLIAGTLELTHGTGGRQQQQAESSHHSLHSAATTGSGG